MSGHKRLIHHHRHHRYRIRLKLLRRQLYYRHRRRIHQQKSQCYYHLCRQSEINNNNYFRFPTTTTTQKNEKIFVNHRLDNYNKNDDNIDINITKLEKRKNAYEQSTLKDFFLKMINSLPTENAFYVYCDGSKKEDKVGCGVLIKDYYGENCDKSIHKRIEDNTSIEEAELHGIHEALKVVANKKRNVYVFVDSQSALSYLQPLKEKNQQQIEKNGKKKMYVQIVENCKKLIGKIQAEGLFVKFYWVPSHVELPNHEYADYLAVQGRERSVIDIGSKRGVVNSSKISSSSSNVINLRLCSVFKS